MRERGFQESDIAKALDGLRIQPCVTEALKYMHDKKGALIRILSDANTFWIDTVLKQSGADKYAFSTLIKTMYYTIFISKNEVPFLGRISLDRSDVLLFMARRYIDKVFTNPSQFDSESGKLVIRPFYEGPEHNCPYGCGPNMCKGMELDKWLKHMQPERIVYVGDGKNDFCPANRLRAGDLLLVRKGLSLDKRICDSKEPLAVPYKYWSSADELAELLHAAFE